MQNPEYLPYKKQKRKGLTFSLALIVLIAGAFGIYQIPRINRALSWRLDIVYTYIHRVLNPVSELPPPNVSRSALVVPTNTPESVEVEPTPMVSPTPTMVPTPIPSAAALPAPAFDETRDIQDWNNCGPATLALYLRHYGWDGDQYDISQIIKPTRDDRNVNVEELTYYVRTHAGWLNAEFRVGGTVERLKELLAAGFPVMIEESFTTDRKYWPEDDQWSGHYLLINAYDDATGMFTTQDSEAGPNQQLSYEQLDENWQSFNRVYIIVYLPDQEQTVKNILGEEWDEDANRETALASAQQEVQENPDSAFAWFNLGSNLTYFERYTEAAQAFDSARSIGLPQRMLRYQFSPFIAYFQVGRVEDLMALTKFALSISRTSEEAMLWRGWGFYQEGDEGTALRYFRDALKIREDDGDALWAIDYVNAN